MQSRPAGARSSGSATPEGRRWVKILAPYGVADPKRSALELVFTALPFLLLWALMLYGLESHGYWACLPLALPAAGFLVRLFMIQHDCGHGSFFRRRSSNDWIGRIIGVLTLTPYGYWRRTHAVHHATTGNLDRRGMGDVPLLTVAEYRALSRWRRIGYRLSRNPLVLLGLGPLFLFVLKYRLPVGLMRDGKGVWISDQFEDTYWARQGAWSFHAGALQGATHYDLPGVLRWFTANIGIHHVHHLASRIPSYRLREALADHAELRDVGRLTLRRSLECFRLALWDEETGKLVAFRDLATPLGSRGR
ncbi:MAG: fatty acid desaturase [Gemmatimonadota bacterium]